MRGRWVARVCLHREPVAPGADPRYHQLAVVDTEGAELTSKTAEVRARARKFSARLQHLYNEGAWEPPTVERPAPPSTAAATAETTVGVWVVRWLGEQRYTEAGRDLERVTQWIDRTPEFRDMPLRTVTPQRAAAWLDALRELTTAKGTTPAPRTLRNVVDPVARAMRAAVFAEILGADPFAVIPSERRPKAVDADPTRRAFYRMSAGEVETLLGEPSIASRWLVLWHLLVLTGCRVSEAIALRWSDVVEDRPGLLRRIRVTRQLHARSRKFTPLKTKDHREVPEHPLLRRVLDWWQGEGWREEYQREPTPADLIVPNRGSTGRPWGAADGAGGPQWSQDVYRALQRDLLACGIDGHRVHDFRHTFASLCADAGMAEEVAATWTHAPKKKEARDLYRAPAWPRQSAEMRKLELSPRPWRATGSG